jgi:hypothetical protein
MTRLLLITAALLAVACESPIVPCDLGGSACPGSSVCIPWEYGDARCEEPLELPQEATEVPEELCPTCGYPVTRYGERLVFCVPDEYREKVCDE